MNRILAGLGLVVGLLLLAIAGLAARVTPWSPPDADVEVSAPEDVDADALAAALSAYLRVDTSNPPGAEAWTPVVLEDGTSRPAWMHHLLTDHVEPLGLRWAEVHGGLAVFVDTPDERPPVLWLSHADVVPVAPNERDSWTHPPFDGVVVDGVVWGRGALDNKASTLVQLAALGRLQARGVTPSRDVVLLVTPDEETGGKTAEAIAADLGSVGSPSAVIDEGSYILPDFLPGATVAAVAVAEKTFASFDLVATGEAGHSSMPKGDSSVDRLVAALARIKAWETEAELPPAMVEGLRRIATTQAAPTSWLMGNADLLAPVVLPVVQGSAAGNAITRDTIVATMLEAGVKDNVIPQRAQATVNARLRPETDPKAFLAALEAVIDDPAIEVVPHAWNVRGEIASWDTDTFRGLEAAAALVAPGAVVIPSRTPGTMDARFFSAAGVESYRFHPFVVDKEGRGGIHGVDERIEVTELVRGVRFYEALLQTQ